MNRSHARKPTTFQARRRTAGYFARYRARQPRKPSFIRPSPVVVPRTISARRIDAFHLLALDELERTRTRPAVLEIAERAPRGDVSLASSERHHRSRRAARPRG